MCRLVGFIWAYMYHDWQSVFLLTWILHSTLYRDTRNFKRFMIFFYMPIFIAIFLWYYVINIYGLLLFWSDEAKSLHMLTYGFF